MKNLFILGNGFDLAHGYKTDYFSFIKWMIDKDIDNEVFENELYRIKNYHIDNKGYNGHRGSTEFSNKITISTYKCDHVWLEIKSELAILIFKDLDKKKWCDIEVLYYTLLRDTKDPKTLNIDLNFLKNKLEEYLSNFEHKNKLNEFQMLFDKLCSYHENLILNFNYTNTFDMLYKSNINCEILKIHGQLNSELNSMIFGYAPTVEETKNLIDKNDNEYLKNIKRYYYKQTESENQLYGFLGDGKGEKINVFIIGHSCGISDRKILSDIFTHPNIKNINIVYYKDYENYFDTLVNIDRVIGKESNYGVVRSFELSLFCPQSYYGVELKERFKIKLENLVKDISDSDRLGRVSFGAPSVH